MVKQCDAVAACVAGHVYISRAPSALAVTKCEAAKVLERETEDTVRERDRACALTTPKRNCFGAWRCSALFFLAVVAIIGGVSALMCTKTCVEADSLAPQQSGLCDGGTSKFGSNYDSYGTCSDGGPDAEHAWCPDRVVRLHTRFPSPIASRPEATGSSCAALEAEEMKCMLTCDVAMVGGGSQGRREVGGLGVAADAFTTCWRAPHAVPAGGEAGGGDENARLASTDLPLNTTSAGLSGCACSRAAARAPPYLTPCLAHTTPQANLLPLFIFFCLFFSLCLSFIFSASCVFLLWAQAHARAG